MLVIYYISLIINILCILTLIIANYLEYKNKIKFKGNKILFIIVLITALIFSISRNLL